MFDITLSDWREHGQLMAESPLSPPASWFYKFLKQKMGFLCKLGGDKIVCVPYMHSVLHFCKWVIWDFCDVA